MLGTSRLLNIALRALILLLIISVVWFAIATHYNRALIFSADLLIVEDITLNMVGSHIFITRESLEVAPTSINSLLLHWGLILLMVLVLAVTGIGLSSRLMWLSLMVVGTFLLHIVGLVLMAYGLGLADIYAGSQRPLFSGFALLVGFLPALIGGLWCFRWWLPRVGVR